MLAPGCGEPVLTVQEHAVSRAGSGARARQDERGTRCDDRGSFPEGTCVLPKSVSPVLGRACFG
jgi:hypothetical protein